MTLRSFPVVRITKALTTKTILFLGYNGVEYQAVVVRVDKGVATLSYYADGLGLVAHVSDRARIRTLDPQ